MKDKLSAVLPLLVLGAAAGFVNGFLGTGGGIILVLGGLFWGKGQNTDAKDLFAGTVLVTLILSAVSAAVYLWQGSLPFGEFPPYLLPALTGGAAGAWLLDRVPNRWTKRLFALLVILGGFLMLSR